MQGSFQRDGRVSKLVEQVLNQVLDAQVGEQLQVEPYERTEKRQGYRNGYREREMVTRVGTITLDVPRNGTFSTELFARYQRSELALILTLMEMVVNGVSTRKVRRVTEELCGTSFSKSTVSDLCRQLDGVVVDWNQCRLDEKGFPFLSRCPGAEGAQGRPHPGLVQAIGQHFQNVPDLTPAGLGIQFERAPGAPTSLREEA